VELESRATERDGRLYYGASGSGPPVVLLHGWPETGRAWRAVWPALVAAGRRVIVPDLRGVGGSDNSPQADYTWRGYAADLDAVLAAEGVESCALVGHDMGGVVMFEWALRNPGRVERLVAISTSFNRYELAKSYYLLILAAPGLGNLFMRVATGSRAAFARALRRNSVHPEVFSDADVDAYYAAAGSSESRRAILAGYRAFFRNRRQRRRELGAVRLDCPALIIWGTKEWALGGDGWQRIKADLPHADVQILDAGHFVVEEQPEVVTKLLVDFLAP
jgi:pimeloyl-ACP methyl ester carboxylesterase